MAAHGYIRTRGVRKNKITGDYEMWCPDCAAKGGLATFHPITDEFWNPRYGLQRCRACWAEKKQRDEKRRKALKREQIVAQNRAYYSNNRELLRWKDNQRKAARRAAAIPPSAPA